MRETLPPGVAAGEAGDNPKRDAMVGAARFLLEDPGDEGFTGRLIESLPDGLTLADRAEVLNRVLAASQSAGYASFNAQPNSIALGETSTGATVSAGLVSGTGGELAASVRLTDGARQPISFVAIRATSPEGEQVVVTSEGGMASIDGLGGDSVTFTLGHPDAQQGIAPQPEPQD